jgi:hypothetical protein
VTRLWDSTSIVDTIFAVSTGLRYGRISTDVISRSFVVCPATNAIKLSASSASPWLGCRPEAS